MDENDRPGDPRSTLHRLRAAATKRLASLTSSFDDIVAAASDVAVDDEHDPEGHTIAWERQQTAALIEETEGTLADIEAAMLRLDVGRYGICSNCDEAIAPVRLDALPATPLCVNCAE